MELEKVYIVVDALDECKKDVLSQLVSSLHSLSSKCRFLFTSRPLPTIESLFRDVPRLPVVPDAEDIRLYIRGRMFEGSQLVMLIQSWPDSITREEVVESVLTKSVGM